ncbi:MAG TPA: helix-turn-helix transcriptional regulator [Candidatus Dormibacteraeota bacterium]|nr:helix-turn-helix transcriptional regulator [Candidatus Dormibacteraeota bacterium]
MTEDAGLRRLSLRETRIARLVAEGLSDEQVAARLGVSVVDVGAELTEAIRKLGLRSRTELALFAPTDPDPGIDNASKEPRE